ncbi:MAG: hypothetical protein OXP09_21210, partial [Gammaproteobacteria bacterium]|nr:hypothetical protein [Gammaproteobacteria bacterium]
HGHIILRNARLSDELNAPKGKRRIRTLSRDSALFLARRRPGAPGCRLAWNRIQLFDFKAKSILHTTGDPAPSRYTVRAASAKPGARAPIPDVMV